MLIPEGVYCVLLKTMLGGMSWGVKGSKLSGRIMRDEVNTVAIMHNNFIIIFLHCDEVFSTGVITCSLSPFEIRHCLIVSAHRIRHVIIGADVTFNFFLSTCTFHWYETRRE